MTVLGTPGREPAELAELGPQRIIAMPGLLEEAVRSARSAQPATEEAGGWRRRADRILKRGRERPEDRAIRAALGGRVRAIDPVGPLDPVVVERLRGIASLGPEIE